MAIGLISLLGRALRRQRVFSRDQRGATAIEFGLLALPFFIIVAAILETAMVFLAGQVLDSAVQDSSRYIRVGQSQSKNVDISGFRKQVCDRLYGMFRDCNALHIEVQTVTDFNSVSITPPVDWTCKSNCGWTRTEKYPTGYAAGPSAIIVVQVYYKWPLLMNIGAVSLANLANGQRLLGSAVVFRNEPFPGA